LQGSEGRAEQSGHEVQGKGGVTVWRSYCTARGSSGSRTSKRRRPALEDHDDAREEATLAQMAADPNWSVDRIVTSIWKAEQQYKSLKELCGGDRKNRTKGRR